ncbi:GNAT family N-acetyltransferase [Bacterioplanes sanyensis]|uniref:GNAT family N-acetyltransferase n=1 Tax=Bacterioplanes sanyensis TaxID=1249553 RepID=A0A222FI45_9GAMM|nr:GNAT family N-acetyltransferase [Bacterioplanes sanyensis]ASP38429.1 GNAT family N-acetyltransferase [Bacterioplanes sanyensis]
MTLSLRPITTDNYEAICDLDVTPEQEAFVACNMWSLVEATYNDGHITRGIYLNDEPVGFFMWVYESRDKVSIYRFMVDQAHQRKGIGRQAMLMALQEIQQDSNLSCIEICYNPNNPVAKDFYASFGFIEVGMDDDDEDMLAEIRL